MKATLVTRIPYLKEMKATLVTKIPYLKEKNHFDSPEWKGIIEAAFQEKRGLGEISTDLKLLAGDFALCRFLGECPHCKKTFKKNRKDQEYCSKKCRQNAGMKRFRG